MRNIDNCATPSPRLQKLKKVLNAAFLVIITWASCTSVTLFASSMESGSRYQFDIPALKVEEALTQLAKQTGHQLLFSANMVSSLQSTAVSGNYTVTRALNTLLDGTPLTGNLTERGVIIVIDSSAQKKTETGRGNMNNLSITTKKTLLAAVVGVFAAGGALGVQAQDMPADSQAMLDEIVVTATKREGSTLQNTAIAMSVLSNEDITKRGLVNMKDYLPTIPSVTYLERGPTDNRIIIRGISLGVGEVQGSVGSYLGEMPMSSAAAGAFDINLVDVERVEVLKGPQGTLYGSSALSGLVRSIPVAPDLQNTEGYIKVGMSTMSESDDYGHSVEGALNIPLIEDQLALRVVAYRDENAGYVDVISTPVAITAAAAAGTSVIMADDIGGSTSTGARASLLWSPSDQLDATLIVGTQELKTDGVSREVSDLGSYNAHYIDTGNGTKAGNESSDVDYGNLTVNYAFDWAVLTSASSFVEGDNTSNVSFFLTSSSSALFAPAFNPVATTTDIFSQELRLASTLDGPVQFIAGLFYEDVTQNTSFEGVNLFNNPPLLFGGSFGLDYQQKAIFGEVSYQFNEVWELTLGGRYFDYDRTDASQPKPGLFVPNPLPAPDIDAGETGDLFKANLSFTPNDNTLLYAQASEGFRLGKGQTVPELSMCDVNNDGLLDNTEGVLTRRVDADTTENFELGGKFTLLDNRLTLNTAIFRIDWSNLPIQIINTTEACPGFTGIVNNLGEARSEGAELEGSFAVTADLLVNFSAAYMDTQVTESRPGGPFSVGEALPYAPQTTASLGVQYDFELADSSSFVRVDMSYVDEYENGFKSNAFPTSGDYFKVNLRAGMSLNESWTFGFYANNLLGEDTITRNDSGLVHRVVPRKIGFETSYNF